jgi:sugar/nucleoside kinase (ribokinase family)
VDQSLIARSDRPTTLAFVTLTGGNASYAFYDENTAGRMVSEADLPAIPDTCEAGFFGGISLAVEPCAEAYTALAAACRRQASSSCSTPISAPVSSPTRAATAPGWTGSCRWPMW